MTHRYIDLLTRKEVFFVLLFYENNIAIQIVNISSGPFVVFLFLNQSALAGFT